MDNKYYQTTLENKNLSSTLNVAECASRKHARNVSNNATVPRHRGWVLHIHRPHEKYTERNTESLSKARIP